MMIKITKKRVRLACLVLSAAVVCAWAQKRITVPKDFPTIQRALGEAVEGDTVYVRNGVYQENITLVDDVILMGQDKKSTIIDGRRRGPVVVGADGAVITGFTIRNGTTGILCKNTRPIISDNIIKDNKGTGIHALVALPEIVNNVVYRNEWTGIFLEGVRGTRTSINHNVIMENGYGGIFGAGRTEVLVRNNILYRNKQYGIFLGPEATRTRIIGNNIFGNRVSFNEAADNQTVRQQNISADPQLVGPGFPRHNYTVRAGSPCKGKGEEGADIGLSGDVRAIAVEAPSSGGGVSELDQFFGPSTSTPAATPEPEPMHGFGGFSADPFSTPSHSFGDDAPETITETVILHGLNFAGETSDILPESFPALDRIYATLAYYTDLRVEIAGHTDNQGDEDFNRRISLERARAVVNYFVDKGIDRSRLRARGYGMERPIADNFTDEGRASNRRVEIVPLR